MRSNVLILVLIALLCATFTHANVTLEYACGEDCVAGQGTTTTWKFTADDKLKAAAGIRFEIRLPVNSTLPNDCYFTPELPKLTNYMGSPVYAPILNSDGQFSASRYHIDVSVSDFPWPSSGAVQLECTMGLSTLAANSGGSFSFEIKALADQSTLYSKNVAYPKLDPPEAFTGSMRFSASAGSAGNVEMDLSNIPYKITEYDMIIIKHHSAIKFSTTTSCTTSGGVSMELYTEPRDNQIILITPSDIAQGEGMLYLRCTINNTPLASELKNIPEAGYQITISTTKFTYMDTSKGTDRYKGMLKLYPPEDAIIGGTADNAIYGFHPNYAGASRYWLLFETNQMNTRVPVETIRSGGDQMTTEDKPGRVMLTVPASVYALDGSTVSCGLNVGNNNPIRSDYHGETTVTESTIDGNKYLVIKWVPETNVASTTFANRVTRFFCSGVKQPTLPLPQGVTGTIEVYTYNHQKLAGNPTVRVAEFHAEKPDTPILSQTFRFNTTNYFTLEQSNLLIDECSTRLRIDRRFITVARQERVQGSATASVDDDTYRLINDALSIATIQPQQDEAPQTRTYLHVSVVISETPELTARDIQRSFQSQVTTIANRVAATLGLTTDVTQPASTLSTLPNTCTNGIRDPDESDVDCGGESSCFGCDVGRKCTKDNDCMSGQCVSGVCYRGNSAMTVHLSMGIVVMLSVIASCLF